jgi:hypothetical protein
MFVGAAQLIVLEQSAALAGSVKIDFLPRTRFRMTAFSALGNSKTTANTRVLPNVALVVAAEPRAGFE